MNDKKMKFIWLYLVLFLGFISFGFSTVTGITTSNDNGVLRVTTDQAGLSNALIDSETVIITGSGRLRGDFDVVSSQLKFSGVGTGNDANAPFTNGARGTTAQQSRLINSSSLFFETTAGRYNIFVSEVSGGSEIIETGGLRRLFVYSQPDAVITDAVFRNIKVHEVYRPFLKFFNVDYIDTETAQLNWEAGRIDRFGINIPSTTSTWYSWLGNGNSGNNAFWDWNPKSIDSSRIVHQNVNNDYYQGFTVSYKFLDKFNSNPVSDVRVKYFDDRGSVGSSLSLVSEYLTDSSGVLVGTVDTRDLSVGSSSQRPTLFVLTGQSRITSGTTSTGLSDPSISQNYVFDLVSSELEVKSYLHAENPSSLSLTSEIGKIDEDLNVEEYANYFLEVDSGVTQSNMLTVLGYSSLDNLEQFYDRAKAEWYENDGYPIFSFGAGVINLGNVTLNVNSSNPVYNYDLGSNTVFVRSVSFSKTSKIDSVVSTGDIVIDSSVPNDVIVTAPVASNLTIVGLPTVSGSNSLCKFVDSSDSSESIISADAVGEIVYSTFSGRSISYFCDAVGYKRSQNKVVTVSSIGVTESVSLDLYRDKLGVKLYGNGISSQKSLVSFSDFDNKFYIDYSASQPIVTYESFFDRLDEIFSSSLGLDYGIEFDFEAGKFKIDSGSNLKLAPRTGASSDPEIDFVSFVVGNSNPNFPYEQNGGRRIIYPTNDLSFEKDLDSNYEFLIDEVKVLNVALNDSEVELLYKDQLRALGFDVVVDSFNSTTKDLVFNVTIPYVEKDEDIVCHFYYGKK